MSRSLIDMYVVSAIKLLVLASCINVVVADDVTKTTEPSADVVSEKELARLLHPSFRHQAAKYKFYLDANRERSLKLVNQPVMSWTGEGSWYGDVFVWTSDGRPRLIGCVGSWPIGKETRGMFHEFHALTEKPLQGVRLSLRHSWKQAEAGVTYKSIEGPSWNKSASRRLFHMRQIARSFTGHMTDNDGNPTVLRMLPQPIYRYETPQGSTVDGAMFAFVWDVGTDPELILILETEQRDEKTIWRYAAARFTWRALSLKRKDAVVWQVPKHEEQHQSQSLKKSYVTVEVGAMTIEQLRADYADDVARKKQP